jgi:hypothetical protein
MVPPQPQFNCRAERVSGARAAIRERAATMGRAPAVAGGHAATAAGAA